MFSTIPDEFKQDIDKHFLRNGMLKLYFKNRWRNIISLTFHVLKNFSIYCEIHKLILLKIEYSPKKNTLKLLANFCSSFNTLKIIQIIKR